MSVPRNVQRFEALLYASLMLDALSVAVQDRTPTIDMTEQMIMTATLLAGGMILLLVYFVWLAAHWRKNWPRWVLAAALVLSVISLGQILGVPVHLFLFVKVRENWGDDPDRYREMGLEFPKE